MPRRRAPTVLFALVALFVVSCRSPSETVRSEPDASVTLKLTSDAAIDGAVTSRSCDGAALTCPPNEYCVYSPGLCGKGKKPGTCRPKPITCNDKLDEVCGCDGKVHLSACAAQKAGVDLDVTGACRERIPDKAACGAHFCDAYSSYCEIVLSDVFELPSDYTCKPLPQACIPERGRGKAAKDCACFPAGTKCLSFCGPIETGGIDGFHLTCRL